MNGTNPPQRQSQPWREQEMHPEPSTTAAEHHGSGKLTGRVVIVSGGDSGIGRSVAVLFAREGTRSDPDPR